MFICIYIYIYIYIVICICISMYLLYPTALVVVAGDGRDRGAFLS